MHKTLIIVAVLVAIPASAAEIEPGIWEFTVNVRAHGLGAFQPKPGPMVSQRCITREQAENPAKLLADAGARGECQFSNQRKTGIQFSFDVRCTAPLPMQGSGTVRYAREAMEGDLDLTGEMQGMRFQTRSHLNGRRLGPCNA